MDGLERLKETMADQRFENLWLKLKHIERVHDQDRSFPRYSGQENHFLLIIAEGNYGQVKIDGSHYPLDLGIVCVCSTAQMIEVTSSNATGTGIFILSFEAGGMRSSKQAEELVDGEQAYEELQAILGVYKLSPAAGAMEKSQKIDRYWRSGNAIDRLYGNAGLYELLGLSLAGSAHSPTSMLELARAELEKRYAEDIKIDDLAALVGLSRFHFMRIFKEKYGKSVLEYVTELRLGKAKRLMVDHPELSLHDIAEQAGYHNAAYFSRIFKKQVGITPNLYWRNRSRKVAAYSWANIGQLLPLQIMPYAAPIDQYWNDYYRKRYQTDVVVPLSHVHDFNLAALKEARPECIIGLDYLIPAEVREKLEQIAPLLLIPWSVADWRQHLRLVADFTDKSKEAENWLVNYDWKAELVRRELQAAVKKSVVLILKIAGTRISVVGRRAATVLYDDLQLKTPYRLGMIDPWLQAVLPHQLEDFHADHIMLSVNEDAASEATWRGLLASGYWQSLRAVKHRMVSYLPGFPWFEFPAGEYSALHHERMLDEVRVTQLCVHNK